MKYLSLILSLTFIQALSAQTKYTEFCGNVFCVDLPAGFNVKDYPENSTDNETYEVTKKGVKFINISASIESRYDMDASINNIQDWYQYILKKRPEISYKLQKDNWFVVSGVDPETGNVFYWKKIWQGEFISDLYIEYPKSKKDQIEPYLGAIAKSFIIHWEETGE